MLFIKDEVIKEISELKNAKEIINIIRKYTTDRKKMAEDIFAYSFSDCDEYYTNGDELIRTEDVLELLNLSYNDCDEEYYEESPYEEEKRLRSYKAIDFYIRTSGEYAAEIKECQKRTKEYNDESPTIVEKRYENTNISIIAKDSVSAVFENSIGKTCLLNFASFTSPGGGFLRGSIAQEEAICHESILYPVLSNMLNVYERNNHDTNHGLYYNRGLYSPDIIFIKNQDTIQADVITCAAPNKNAMQATNQENLDALFSRIEFVLKMAADNQVETLILGAFGCGAFGQDAGIVSVFFMKLLKKYNGVFQNVIFAIPGGKNLETFIETFKKTA